ncbi:MAG: hypothetical protein AAF569_07130 [Pseudomonadota bacterium]
MAKKSKSNPVKFIFMVLGLVILMGGIFVYLNFGDLTKRAAERIASNALGVTVKISSLDISLTDKKVTVNGLKIGNPPGYKKPYAMTSERINIGLNTASKELIDFKNIQVEGSVVNLEVTEKGTNLNDLKKLAQAKPQKESMGSETIRVIVQNMVIGASTLNPSVTLLGGDLGTINIPSVRLSGIGRKENGVLARDAITQIITKYMSVAEKEANQAGYLKGVTKEVEKIEKVVDDVKKDFKVIFGD